MSGQTILIFKEVPMPKEVIRTPKLPETSLPLSHATMAGNTLFIGGSVAQNAFGQIVAGDIRVQTQQALENIRALVEAAGGTMRDITRTTVYLTDMANYAAMNEAYARFFPVDPPARATLRVDLANPKFLIEIEATAVLG
jgi:reactive intermediate/imine deaminase